MKRIIDITHDNFFRLDNWWQIVDTYIPRKCPETMEFQVWGGILWLEAAYERGDLFLPESFGKEDLYVANMGKLTFHGIEGGKHVLHPYNSPRKRLKPFLYNQDGTRAEYVCDWGIPASGIPEPVHDWGTPAEGVKEYEWGADIAWPASYVEFLIYASGPVTFEFDDSILIPRQIFENDPQKYEFKY